MGLISTNTSADKRPSTGALGQAEKHWRHRRGFLLALCCLGSILLTALAVRCGLAWLNQTKAVSFCAATSGPARKFAEKLAILLANSSGSIRLSIVTAGDPVAAFGRRECDLAVVRSDAKMLGWARAIANLEKEILLRAGRTVTDWMRRRQAVAPHLSLSAAILEIADFGSIVRTGNNDHSGNSLIMLSASVSRRN